MTAKEKFMARVDELGLTNEWAGDRVGKVLDDGTIVILIHYDWDKDDPYHEIHYPSFDKLREYPSFVKECKECFYDSDDDKFVASLAYWLEFGSRNGGKCPLYPVDVYFPADGLELYIKEFHDDNDVVDSAIDVLCAFAKGVNMRFTGVINGRSFDVNAD